MDQLEPNDYKKLLNIYNVLHNTNEKKKKLGIHDYSLMNSLLKKTDEVNLHSNFIYSMINPNGSHYYGSKFLELFLKSINEDDFIDIKNAKVYKEKGKIDLLVEDGNHVLIIENKLIAPDQKYQISRYIQYVIENYLDNNKENLDKKIHIVYLSEYKATPTDKSKSIIGFKSIGKELKWQNSLVSIEVIKKGKYIGKLNLDLSDDTCLKFNRVRHSKELSNWAIKVKEYLVNKHNSQSLIYAFDEYKLILDRLKDNKWRNIMSLDQYTLEIKDEKEQEEMYTFMCEANKTLNDYLSQKLWEVIVATYDKSKMQKLTLPSKNGQKEFKEFTETSCNAWFHQRGESKKYRDTGFMIDDKYYFALGRYNIAYGLVSEGWVVKTNRKNLQTKSKINLFALINDLNNIDK